VAFTVANTVAKAAFKGNTQLKAGYLPQAKEDPAGRPPAWTPCVRKALQHDAELDCVQALDDRLYG